MTMRKLLGVAKYRFGRKELEKAGVLEIPDIVVVTCFATSIYRMQILTDLATQFERKVAFVGRSMMRNAEIAQRLAERGMLLTDDHAPVDQLLTPYTL